MCLVDKKRADIARVLLCENNFCTEFAHQLHFCGLQKLKTLILCLFHHPLNPRNHFSTVLIETNWYTMICKYDGCIGFTHPIIVNDMFVFLPMGYEGHYSIPENISTINGGAFWGCEGLTSVTIPNSVTSIGNGTFAHCYGLTSVTIPNSVTSIGDCAFYGCKSLISISIPDSVKSMVKSAFSGCSSLQSIIIPPGTKQKFASFLPDHKDKLVEQ